MHAVIKNVVACLSLAVLAHGAPGIAQDKSANYPVRPIRILISVAPGAGADFVARTTAQILNERWGQNVVVDPRPGGGGVIATETAARAAPDGYTIYQNGFGLLLQGAMKRVPFDVLKAFDPVVRSTTQPYLLLVHPSVQANNLKELVALSHSKPLTYAGSAGVGSIVHLGMERMGQLSGMKVRHIAYKGSAPALLALMGGEVNMVTPSIMAGVAAINTGKVKAIATMGPTRSPALPDLPTLAEQGLPGYSLTNRYVLWVPAGTPRAVQNAINQVVSDGLRQPDVMKRLANDGTQPDVRMTPDELKKDVAREYAELERLVKDFVPSAR